MSATPPHHERQVPEGMKVAVVSVVGAFRTGKSFLLTFLLRYLRYGSELDESEDWMTAAGDLREGNINEKLKVRVRMHVGACNRSAGC